MGITGSSAKLFSTEIATAMRERSLTTELWPFSFREVLRHRGIAAPVDPAGERHFVQVCATLGDAETRDRELRSLAEAMAETEVDRAVIVTLANDGVERFEGHVVRVIPAWRWLLEA